MAQLGMAEPSTLLLPYLTQQGMLNKSIILAHRKMHQRILQGAPITRTGAKLRRYSHLVKSNIY